MSSQETYQQSIYKEAYKYSYEISIAMKLHLSEREMQIKWMT